MKAWMLLFVALALFFVVSCGNDDDADNDQLPYEDWDDFYAHLNSQDWTFGIEVDPQKSEYAEIWLIQTNEELSIDDEVLMTVNGETVLSELSVDDDNEVYLDITNSLIPASRDLHVVFTYNGATVFDNTITIPEHSTITSVEISTPDEPIDINWEVNHNSQMQLLEFGAQDSVIWLGNNFLLDGAARSITIPGNTYDLSSFYMWSAELFQMNESIYHNSSIVATVIAADETRGSMSSYSRIKERLKDNR